VKEGDGGGTRVNERILSTIGSLGENIVLRRAAFAHAHSGFIGVAAHGGTTSTSALGRLGAMIHVETKDTNDSLLKAADPIANKVN
jgi:translation elongation factor EF-Ts